MPAARRGRARALGVGGRRPRPRRCRGGSVLSARGGPAACAAAARAHARSCRASGGPRPLQSPTFRASCSSCGSSWKAAARSRPTRRPRSWRTEGPR
eukprot:2016299-Pyramimonas_sp.AAC.1